MKKKSLIQLIDFEELRLSGKLGLMVGLLLFPPGIFLWILSFFPSTAAGKGILSSMSLAWLQRGISFFIIAGWSAAATSFARQAIDFIAKRYFLPLRFLLNVLAGTCSGLLVANCFYSFLSFGLPIEKLIPPLTFFLFSICFSSYLSSGFLFMNSMPHLSEKYRGLWILIMGLLAGLVTPLVLAAAFRLF